MHQDRLISGVQAATGVVLKDHAVTISAQTINEKMSAGVRLTPYVSILLVTIIGSIYLYAIIG